MCGQGPNSRVLLKIPQEAQDKNTGRGEQNMTMNKVARSQEQREGTTIQ